jgi:tetratricopeptide (TPR) repeat protein
MRVFFLLLALWLLGVGNSNVRAVSPADVFRDGAAAYRTSDYAAAIKAFRQSANLQPASGTLQDLGLAEWHRGHAGAAILSWEQSLWLEPFNAAARGNLGYARKVAQLESPELAWYEVVSTWLPANWWAWIAGISFWTAIALVMLPAIFRQPKAAWHQAVAALGLTIFLLSIPAHIGVHTRSHIGFVQQKDTPLRLTPTQEAQSVTRLAAGEPARLERQRGNYLLIRTNRSAGWVERRQFALICRRP